MTPWRRLRKGTTHSTEEIIRIFVSDATGNARKIGALEFPEMVFWNKEKKDER